MSAKKGSTPWNKGTAKGFIDNRGYRSFKIGTRTIREHRLVMEKHLGRKLEAWEHIHHKDGNKLNNDVSNLEILDAETHAKEHAGNKRTDQHKITMATIRSMRQEIVYLKNINSEMLEALELLVSEIEGNMLYESDRKNQSSTDKWLQKLVDTGNKAIKKARGES